MKAFTVNQIGTILNDDMGNTSVQLDAKYADALKELDGFSHICVLWWFDGCDNAASRSHLTVESPYVGSPETMGTFATRSPERPNPIALSVTQVINIDCAAARIDVAYLDAENGSPVLDIKPYTPSLDRVENPSTPEWCTSWPKSLEKSGEFDWSQVFNF